MADRMSGEGRAEEATTRSIAALPHSTNSNSPAAAGGHARVPSAFSAVASPPLPTLSQQLDAASGGEQPLPGDSQYSGELLLAHAPSAADQEWIDDTSLDLAHDAHAYAHDDDLFLVQPAAERLEEASGSGELDSSTHVVAASPAPSPQHAARQAAVANGIEAERARANQRDAPARTARRRSGEYVLPHAGMPLPPAHWQHMAAFYPTAPMAFHPAAAAAAAAAASGAFPLAPYAASAESIASAMPLYYAAPPAMHPGAYALHDEERRFMQFQLARQTNRQAITPPSQMRAELRRAAERELEHEHEHDEQATAGQAQRRARAYDRDQQQQGERQGEAHRAMKQPPSYAATLHSDYPSLRQPLEAHRQQQQQQQQRSSADSHAHDSPSHYAERAHRHAPSLSGEAMRAEAAARDRAQDRDERWADRSQAAQRAPAAVISPASSSTSTSPAHRPSTTERQPSRPPSPPQSPPSPPLPAVARRMMRSQPDREQQPQRPPRAAQAFPASQADTPRSAQPAASSVTVPASGRSSPPPDVAALRATIDRLTAAAAQQAARESDLNKQLAAKERALQAEKDNYQTLHAKFLVSEDRVHELSHDLQSAKSALSDAELRAASVQEQCVKLRKALQEVSEQHAADRERLTRATREQQHLAKKLAQLLQSMPEQVMASIEEPLPPSLLALFAAALASPTGVSALPSKPPSPRSTRSNHASSYAGSHAQQQAAYGGDPSQPLSARAGAAALAPSHAVPPAAAAAVPRRGWHNESQLVFQDPIDDANELHTAGSRRRSAGTTRVDAAQLPPAGIPAPLSTRSNSPKLPPADLPLAPLSRRHAYDERGHDFVSAPSSRSQTRDREVEAGSERSRYSPSEEAQWSRASSSGRSESRRSLSPTSSTSEPLEARHATTGELRSARGEGSMRAAAADAPWAQLPPSSARPSGAPPPALFLPDEEWEATPQSQADSNRSQRSLADQRRAAEDELDELIARELEERRRLQEELHTMRQRESQRDSSDEPGAQRAQSTRWSNNGEMSTRRSSFSRGAPVAPSEPSPRIASHLLGAPASLSPRRSSQRRARESGGEAPDNERHRAVEQPLNAMRASRADAEHISDRMNRSSNFAPRDQSDPPAQGERGAQRDTRRENLQHTTSDGSEEAGLRATDTSRELRPSNSATDEAQLDQWERELSHLMQQREQLAVAVSRASRPGASFDASLLPAGSLAQQGSGARSRHAMRQEGEQALQDMDKEIQAIKHAVRKLRQKLGW